MNPEPPPHATPPRPALIVGCGYLGRRLVQQRLAQGGGVFATTRNPNHAEQLARLGARPLLLDVNQPLTFASLKPVLDAEKLDTYVTIPQGQREGIAQLGEYLQKANVHRAVMTTSTAVYSQSDAQTVDADTPPDPVSERAKQLHDTEAQWLRGGDAFSVLRLAGLYGPGRIIGEKALRQRAPLIGNPDAMLNLIHVHDAVSLLLAMTWNSAAAPIELGCDGSPVKRIDYYQTLADKLALSAPIHLDDHTAATRFGLDTSRLSCTPNKKLDNTPTRRRTGWTPAYPNYIKGLSAILDESAQSPPHTPGHPC